MRLVNFFVIGFIPIIIEIHYALAALNKFIFSHLLQPSDNFATGQR